MTAAHLTSRDLLAVSLAGLNFTISEALGIVSTCMLIAATLPLALSRWRDYLARRRVKE